jgi:hypothetical protein
MKTNKSVICAFRVVAATLLSLQAATLQAVDHSQHGGSKSHADHSSGVSCQKAKINKINPLPLSEMTPGSKFSFMAFDVYQPKNIEVSIKKINIPLTLEDKGDLVIVQGQLPENLMDMPVRISVKIKAKNPKCNTEEGWLVKITH